MKFLSLEVALYLSKSAIRSCMEYFCWISYKNGFAYSRERSTRHSDRFYDFPVTIPRCDKDVYVNSFFGILWNSLTIEWFPLTYDLNGLSLELTDIF